MNMPERIPYFANRIEAFIRRLFERVGGAIDFSLRRGEQARTDLSSLIPQLERAVEANLKTEAGRVTAPNLFELRYDFETWTRMGDDRRQYLQHELRDTIYEYIHNRRYVILAPVAVAIAYDAFTRGLDIRAGFGEAAASEVTDDEAPQTAVHRRRLVIRSLQTRQELRAEASSGAEPVGVGRNIANQMVINDATVSNFHAAFKVRPDGMIEVADRASANGTAVNGVQLAPGDRTIVRDGDRIRFGEVETTLAIIED